MKDKLDFKYLPDYASHLLKNHSKEFTIKQLQLLRELNVRLLKYFSGLSDEELINGGVLRTNTFFEYFKNNDAKGFIQKSLDEWLANQIPRLSREKLLPEDITTISFIRRKLFRDFLPTYTSDNELGLKIMEEVDRFTVEIDTLSFKNLLEIQHKLYEQAEVLAHIGNWSMDTRNKQITWSDGMFRIYELEPVEDVNSYDLTAMIHPDDIKKLTGATENSIVHNVPYEIYYRIIIKNGTTKYLHAKGEPELDSNNKVIKIFGTLQDVTSQKLAEEKLKSSEERYHEMVNEVQDYAIIRLNKYGDVENWNKGAENIKGYTEQEIIGKNFRVFYTPADQAKGIPEQALEIAAREGKARREGWRMRKDRSVFWGNIVITALYDKEGNLTGFSKVTRDLTDIKIAEEKLKVYAENLELKNKKLEQANKELESFSYIASHDLQEPLRKIQAFTSRLLQKENDNLSEWGKDVFGKVQTSASRMQRLIEALLNFSRLDKMRENFEPTDINALLEEVKSALHDSIENKHVIIESEKLPVIPVIPIQFQQLLTNLLSNAIKYTKPEVQQHIKITYGLTEGNHIPGNIPSDRNKYHHICVADNGIGFEQEYAEKIFELFQRLHGKSEYEGTGIGLAICKKIVNNHHGFIYAKGQPDQGSEFHVYIPSEKKVEIVNPSPDA